MAHYLLTAADYAALARELESLTERHRREIAERLRVARGFSGAPDDDDLLAVLEEAAIDRARIAQLGRAGDLEGGERDAVGRDHGGLRLPAQQPARQLLAGVDVRQVAEEDRAQRLGVDDRVMVDAPAHVAQPPSPPVMTIQPPASALARAGSSTSSTTSSGQAKCRREHGDVAGRALARGHRSQLLAGQRDVSTRRPNGVGTWIIGRKRPARRRRR